MPIDWRDYDEFDWDRARQDPMESDERRAMEAFVVDLLGFSEDERARPWGAASPPGRYAATVIHLFGGIAHRYSGPARTGGISEIGVKVFKTTPDAHREARRILPFHCEAAHRLPGLPNEHVQKTLCAGSLFDDRGAERKYIIQEWVPGVTIEDLVRRRTPEALLDGRGVRSLLEQLFDGIIIPLWAEGTIWWDVRDANYCWNEASGRLTLIDVDSLAAYVQEITETPERWERREKGRRTALARLRQMTLRLLLMQGGSVRMREIRGGLERAWQTGLEPALQMLGRDPARKEVRRSEALAALQRFLDGLAAADLLSPR
jgi:hypothetical protein